MSHISRALALSLSVWLLLALWRADARAQGSVQASIAGVVSDSSGAVLPGVTVEASSPVLIEKSRSAISDSTGRYRIVGLTPGTYTIIFTLQGFNTSKREGVLLSGSLAATIDIEMRIGSLEETVTVSGESPIVDVQTVKQQRVIGSETFTSIPGSHSYHNLVVLPKVNVQVSGTLQSRPGVEITANWNVPASVVAQSLGRPPSGNVATVPVNILTAGELYGDRLTQVDLRVAKLLKYGRLRTNVGVDVYNVFNSNVPLGYVTTYGTTWGRPNSVLDARFAKVSAQFDF